MLERLFLIMFWGVATGIFSMGAWGGWAERVYDRHQDSEALLVWMDFLDIPPQREHGVRFLKLVSMLAVGAVTLSVLSGLMLAE